MKEKGIKVNGADMAVFFAHQTSDDRKKTFLSFKDVYGYVFSPVCWIVSSILFSTIRWILERSCSLFEDGILALQRKTNSLLVIR